MDQIGYDQEPWAVRGGGKGTAMEAELLASSADLVGVTYQRILEELLSLSIAPGDRISVDRLARQFGVSQTPVRAALSRLEAEGLVTKSHLKGFRCAPTITTEEFEDLHEIRCLIEPLASARAAKRRTGPELESLEASVELMAGLAQRDNTIENRTLFARTDAQFHELIAQVSGSRFIGGVVEQLHAHVQIFRLSQHRCVTGAAATEHRRILDAIAAQDSDEAAKQMAKHLDDSRRRFICGGAE